MNYLIIVPVLITAPSLTSGDFGKFSKGLLIAPPPTLSHTCCYVRTWLQTLVSEQLFCANFDFQISDSCLFAQTHTDFSSGGKEVQLVEIGCRARISKSRREIGK